MAKNVRDSPAVYFLFDGVILSCCQIASTRFFVAASILISSGQRPAITLFRPFAGGVHAHLRAVILAAGGMI